MNCNANAYCFLLVYSKCPCSICSVHKTMDFLTLRIFYKNLFLIEIDFKIPFVIQGFMSCFLLFLDTR